MDKLKYIKLENEDGSYSSSIPISVEAQYIDINNEQDLADYINENNINIHNLQNTTSGLNNKVDANTSAIQGLASGSPKGIYATAVALKTANPDTAGIKPRYRTKTVQGSSSIWSDWIDIG